MKTKEYVSKYNLSKGDKFNHTDFVSDLTIDFISLLEVGNATESLKGFENAVRAIRMKWDAINNKTLGQLPDKLWGYFYATTIAETKERLFPEQLKAIREEQERRQKQWQDRKEQEDREANGFFDWLFDRMEFSHTPHKELSLLNLDNNASVEDIKSAYRKMALKSHPDVGGNPKTFVELTEAKNTCLAWAQKNQKTMKTTLPLNQPSFNQWMINIRVATNKIYGVETKPKDLRKLMKVK